MIIATIFVLVGDIELVANFTNFSIFIVFFAIYVALVKINRIERRKTLPRLFI